MTTPLQYLRQLEKANLISFQNVNNYTTGSITEKCLTLETGMHKIGHFWETNYHSLEDFLTSNNEKLFQEIYDISYPIHGEITED